MRRGAPASRLNALLSQDVPELPGLPDGISVWTAASLDDLRRKATAVGRTAADEAFQKALFQTIDMLGARSQRAQEISEPLTSVSRLHENATYKLYMLSHERKGMAILKVGVKKLFLTHPTVHQLVEVDPVCVLDFYVTEDSQRKGFGRQLFEEMLRREGVSGAEQLAIDRPSTKFIHFLRKHYGLADIAPQVNNFVVFARFFDNTRISERGKLLRPAGGQGRTQPGSAAAKEGQGPKNGSPEAAHGGSRASGGVALPIVPHPRNAPSSSHERDRRHHPRRDDVAHGEGMAALGKVAPYQPMPMTIPHTDSSAPPLRRGDGGMRPSYPPLANGGRRLVPATVHNDTRSQRGDHRGYVAVFPLHVAAADEGDDDGRVRNEAAQRPYNIQLLLPLAAAAEGRGSPQLRLNGRSERFPLPQRAAPSSLDRSPMRGVSPPRANNFYNGYGEREEPRDVVVSLSPEDTPPRHRSPARGVERKSGRGEDGGGTVTPQRHAQANGRSRVAYNIITGAAE